MASVGELGEQLTEAVLTEDVDNVTSRYSADAVLISPEGTFTGREEIGRFFGAWFDAFSHPMIVETLKLESGDHMAVESTFSAVHTAPLQLPSGAMLAPTGKRITLRAMEAYRIVDGEIAEHRFYYDKIELLSQLGVAVP